MPSWFADPRIGLREARSVRGRSRSEAGFLLLEAVLALAIIGIAAIAVLSTTAGQVRSADKASVLLTARALADDRIASFRVLGHEDLLSPPDSLLSGTFPAPFDEYSWSARVEPLENEYDLFSLEVLVSGRAESLPLSTLLHRPRPAILAQGDS